MKELQRLMQELSRSSDPSVMGFHGNESEAMTKVLEAVKKAFDSPSGNVSLRTAEKALLSFRRLRKLSTYLDIKYICFALACPVGRDNWRLLDDEELFSVLLTQVQKQTEEARRFRKCYQGMLSGYWQYPVFDEKNISNIGRKNWVTLRDFLRKNLPKIVRENQKIAWVNTLKEHDNLLTGDPCKRYSADLLKGDDSQFIKVRTELGIPANCWLMEQIIYSQVEAACEKQDDAFKKHLELLLCLTSTRKGNFYVSDYIARKCLARMLQRYAKCARKAEHIGLREAAISRFGNPWIRRPAWDAFVGSEDARKMVESWLRIWLMTDFFSLLSDDGSADERRLQYWLRFEPGIEEMWFALGTYAEHNRSKEFVEIRQRAEGLLLALNQGGSPQNNAFIMRIEQYFVVEFSAKGNACFIFRADEIPFSFQSYVECSLLKSSHDRLLHRDFPTRGQRWEDVFDEKLLPLVNFRPKPLPPAAIRRPSKSTSVGNTPDGNLLKAISAMGLEMQDYRPKGGALWVIADDADLRVHNNLKSLGFKYKSGRGWWKE